MIPRFIPVKDLNGSNEIWRGKRMKGVQFTNKDWAALYKDESAGDSLRNAVGHWNWEQTCIVDVPFLIIGGVESITDVIIPASTIRCVSPYDGGVVALINKSKDGLLSKSRTTVLVIPSAVCQNVEARPIENLGQLAILLKQKNDKPSEESLSDFRFQWRTYETIHARYIDV